jgi:hypothetical protein
MGKEKLQAESGEWVRFYRPTDPEIYHQIFGKKPNQRLLAAHQFKLDRIIKIANDVNLLARDIEAFEKTVSLLPVRIPQPAF